MNPPVGQERSSVRCGGPWWMLAKLSWVGLVEAGGALLHEGFGEEKTPSRGVRGANTTVKGPCSFQNVRLDTGAHGPWQAGLSPCFSPTSPTPPHPHPLGELMCQGQWGSIEDLGLGKRDYWQVRCWLYPHWWASGRWKSVNTPWEQRWSEKLETRIPTWQSEKRVQFCVWYAKLSPIYFCKS